MKAFRHAVALTCFGLGVYLCLSRSEHRVFFYMEPAVFSPESWKLSQEISRNFISKPQQYFFETEASASKFSRKPVLAGAGGLDHVIYFDIIGPRFFGISHQQIKQRLLEALTLWTKERGDLGIFTAGRSGPQLQVAYYYPNMVGVRCRFVPLDDSFGQSMLDEEIKAFREGRPISGKGPVVIGAYPRPEKEPEK